MNLCPQAEGHCYNLAYQQLVCTKESSSEGRFPRMLCRYLRPVVPLNRLKVEMNSGRRELGEVPLPAITLQNGQHTTSTSGVFQRTKADPGKTFLESHGMPMKGSLICFIIIIIFFLTRNELFFFTIQT